MVSSRLHCSKKTYLLQHLLWESLSRAAITAWRLFFHIFPTLCVARYWFMQLNELGGLWELNCPSFEMVATWFEPAGFPWLVVRHSVTLHGGSHRTHNLSNREIDLGINVWHNGYRWATSSFVCANVAMCDSTYSSIGIVYLWIIKTTV